MAVGTLVGQHPPEQVHDPSVGCIAIGVAAGIAAREHERDGGPGSEDFETSSHLSGNVEPLTG